MPDRTPDLVGMDAVLGEIKLDESGGRGTLNLIGSGSDSVGGEFASIYFDLVGNVQPL